MMRCSVEGIARSWRYGRIEHPLGELGGLPIDATLRRSLADGTPTLELTIRDRASIAPTSCSGVAGSCGREVTTRNLAPNAGRFGRGKRPRALRAGEPDLCTNHA